jgi:hypothetical protein
VPDTDNAALRRRILLILATITYLVLPTLAQVPGLLEDRAEVDAARRTVVHKRVAAMPSIADVPSGVTRVAPDGLRGEYGFVLAVSFRYPTKRTVSAARSRKWTSRSGVSQS